MTIERDRTLCFSGHRYYAGAATDEERLASALEAARADGYRTFVSGMARGFDLAAAEAVVRLRDQFSDVRLVTAIPFSRQSAKYSLEDRHRYDAVLAVADEVRVLAERYSYGCYYRRDDWMVERSARIICWYDGSKGSGHGSGGTRYTVRHAVATGLEVVNLYREADTLF